VSPVPEAAPGPRVFRPAVAAVPCFHGGAFFEAVGEDFRTLGRHGEIINADVLDAWFPPAPAVLDALREHLPWLARTSPPTHAGGLVRAVAEARGVSLECVLPGGGSSDLIFLALREWLSPGSRAVVLNPTYGEYNHVLDEVVRCRVERLGLDPARDYEVDLGRLAALLATAPDLVVLVNPNSPTGRHIPAAALEAVLRAAPRETLIWIDETYDEYAGPGESLERFAAGSANVIVCKSMSKVYALSGLRCAYLCGPSGMIAALRALTPPWAVGLPAQVAAVKALEAPDYYAARYAETRELRAELADALAGGLGWKITPGVANFVLAELPADAGRASAWLARCRERGLFLRGLPAGDRLLRVAVKDRDTQRRMLTILREVNGLDAPI